MTDMDRPMTARLTNHARQRCDEMRINTKRVKNLVRNPDPEITVVYAKQPDGACTVITVLYRQYDEYTRPGETA